MNFKCFSKNLNYKLQAFGSFVRARFARLEVEEVAAEQQRLALEKFQVENKANNSRSYHESSPLPLRKPVHSKLNLSMEIGSSSVLSNESLLKTRHLLASVSFFASLA